MTDPILPITIRIRNANLSAGEYVKITNFTRGDSIREKVNSSGELIVEPQKYGFIDWDNGDSIQIESLGRIPFVSTGTVTKHALTKTSTTSTADTSTPAVDL